MITHTHSTFQLSTRSHGYDHPVDATVLSELIEPAYRFSGVKGILSEDNRLTCGEISRGEHGRDYCALLMKNDVRQKSFVSSPTRRYNNKS